MAFLAQPWHSLFQQRRIVGAMRRVAIGAIVKHWRVFPQEGTALVGVAGITGLVSRLFDQHFRTCGTMGVVALRASGFAG